MNAPLKVAIAGLGTVGTGTAKLLQANADLIAGRSGRPVKLVAIAERIKKTDHGINLDGVTWYDDAAEMVAKADADVFVELIGGADGIAKRVVEGALARKRHVVTANKAMLAHHGFKLAEMAEGAGVTLAYEAAVAGGIPIIKALREGLGANRISRVSGILNGTCNYILTTMRETGRDFGDVLSEAQKLGYAEADPAFDIDGVDAAHKLALLAQVAFGARVDFSAVAVEGIRNVTATDIQYANEFGYRIKLLGIAECVDGAMSLRVSPCLVPPDMPLFSVEGVFNAVVAEGDYVGRSVYEGRGAGAGPTASAVVSDIIDIAVGRRVPTFGLPLAELRKLAIRPLDARVGACYVRLTVVDRPGVFADIAAAFRDENVSMESVLQRGRNVNANVNVVIVTHESEDAALIRALKRLQSNAAVVEPPHMMRIEPMQRA
jgi:homoserine dehydrogenase